MLLKVALSGEAPVTGSANKRSFFGMASVMDVQGTLTGKHFAADIARRVLEGAPIAEVEEHAQGVF